MTFQVGSTVMVPCDEYDELKRMADISKEVVRIEVYQQDWMPGYAAFVDDGSIKENAKAHVVINLGASITQVKLGHLDKKDLPYKIVSDLLHEITHALEAWAGVEFSEERVDEIVAMYENHVLEKMKQK